MPKGRSFSQGELRHLFVACNVSTPGGARDAAAVALLFGCGLRRSEVVSLDLGSLDRRTGALVVMGKGHKVRTTYVTNGARSAVETWLRIRGEDAGPLLLPVSRHGRIHRRRLSDQAIFDLVHRLTLRAGVEPWSPHDARRTFVGDLLDAGADLVAVQRLCAHASPTTTARYDRRGERAKRRAAELMHVPFGDE